MPGAVKVICHMMVSLDGKTTGHFFQNEAADPAGEFYDEEISQLAPKAWGCGRKTFEDYTNDLEKSLDLKGFSKAEVPEGDYVVPLKEETFAVVFDRKGRLPWKHSTVEYPEGQICQLLVVLTALAPKEYLAYLRKLGIGYLLAGKDDLDIPLFLAKLHADYGIDRFALCGGGTLNGGFFARGMVDEISLVVAPVIDGASKGISPVEAPASFAPVAAKLMETKTLGKGGLWLHYQFAR